MVALVLLPGLDGTGLLFADFAAALGPDVEVIVASYPTDTPLAYAELETVARSFLPQDRPFFLLAESFSGPIGIAIAATPPPGLLGLILCCSFARNPVPMLVPLRPLVRALPVSVVPMRLLSVFLLGRFASTALLAALADSLARVAPSVFRERIRAVLNVDVTAELARVRVPLLYLRAMEDRVVGRTSGERVKAIAPNTVVLDFAAPHFLLQVLPSQAASHVAAFMRTAARNG